MRGNSSTWHILGTWWIFADTVNRCYSEAQVFTWKVPKAETYATFAIFITIVDKNSYPIKKKLKIQHKNVI